MLKEFKKPATPIALATALTGSAHAQRADGTLKTVVDIGMVNVAGNTRVTAATLLAKTDRDECAVEAGASLNRQRSTAGVSTKSVAARAATRCRHGVGERAFFQQAVEVLPNVDQTDDLRINSESQLVAPLARRVSLKVSYAVKFDNLPEPGFF